MPRLFCFGYGYSAARLGARLRAEGWRVGGTTRSEDKRVGLAAQDVEAALDDDTAAVASACRAADAILVSAAPGEDGDPTLARHGDAVATAAARGVWIGYLSTTGVYGDHDGAWIDETAPRSPATRRGALRVAAEDAWRAAAPQVCRFRLAGIYGPGRGPFEKIRSGTARRIVKPGQVFSRIHVDDIAETLRAALERRPHAEDYNVCDDEPAPPQNVIAYAADLLGAPRPPEVDFETAKAEMSPMAVSFYAESKRVSNTKIKEALGVRLTHPSYREGLAAILRAESRVDADRVGDA